MPGKVHMWSEDISFGYHTCVFIIWSLFIYPHVMSNLYIFLMILLYWKVTVIIIIIIVISIIIIRPLFSLWDAYMNSYIHTPIILSSFPISFLSHKFIVAYLCHLPLFLCLLFFSFFVLFCSLIFNSATLLWSSAAGNTCNYYDASFSLKGSWYILYCKGKLNSR